VASIHIPGSGFRQPSSIAVEPSRERLQHLVGEARRRRPPGGELTAVAEGSIHQGRIGVYDVTVTGNTGRIIAVFRASPTGSPASRSKA